MPANSGQSMSSARSSRRDTGQPARSATSLQPLRVGRVRRADHDQRIHARGDGLHRLLPVGGGVADVFLVRRGDAGEAGAQRLHDLARVVHRERGLRHEGEPLGIRRRRATPRPRWSRPEAPRPAATGPWCRPPRVAGMADQHDRAAAPPVELGLPVHLRDQRAGGVDGEELARGRPPRARISARRGRRRSPARRSSGTSSSSSTNTAPFRRRLSTTYLLCTISWRT